MDKNPAILNQAEIEGFADRLFHAELNLKGIAVDEQRRLRLLAAEALFYFHRNQLDDITSEQQVAVSALYQAANGSITKLIAPVALLPFKKVKQKPNIVGIRPKRLVRLIDHCISEYFPVNLATQAIDGALSVESPFSNKMAVCQESYEINKSNGLQCLRFVDEDKTFFLMQMVSTADGLFLPEAHTLIVLDMAHSIGAHIDRFYTKFFNQFAALCVYARSRHQHRFWSFIGSYSRPANYYYEILPTMFEVYQKHQNITLISRTPDQDYNDLALLFDNCQYLKLTSDEIDSKIQSEQCWNMHLGVNRFRRLHHYSFYHFDQAMVAKILAQPTTTALTKVQQIEGCYPLVWVGIEGQKRCWIEQIDGYAYILNKLAQQYPNLGVVVDGWTVPFTPSAKSLAEADKDRVIARALVQKLNKSIKSTLVAGETSNTKLYVGYRVDFFISNFSTGSMHISRMLRKPGFCHSGQALAESSLRMGVQTHPNRHVYLLPKHLIYDKPEFSLSVYKKTKTLMTTLFAKMKGQLASTSPAKRNIGAVSYSIDKQAFYSFVDQRLSQVLANKPSTKVDFFIELPFTVSPSLRTSLKMATYGNLIIIHPEQKRLRSVNELVELPSEFLCRHIIYGHLGLKAHEALSLDGEYSIWLREPLARLSLHLSKLSKDHQDYSNLLSSGLKKLDNPYTRLLSGHNAPFGKCTEAMLEAALAKLAHLKFVGCAEKTMASLDVLCTTFDWDRAWFPSKIDDAFSQSPVQFGAEERLLAEPLITFDKKLYQYVLSSRYCDAE